MEGNPPSGQDAENLTNLKALVETTNANVAGGLEELATSVEEHAVTNVKNHLSELETTIKKIPSPELPPKTTLQLQGQASVEGAWQNYLQYFLNPDATHGLGSDTLLQFLRGLDQVSNADIPTRVSDDVIVEAEIESPNGNRPDIIIRDPGDFFICCELKLNSAEGDNQTQRYIDDAYVGTTQKQQFPDHRQHYTYIRRPNHPRANADGFVNITWLHIKSWFEPLLLNNHGRYPTRTTAQLADFLDTIQQDMTQDEHIQTAQEKMRLYLTHQDAIREARNGLETAHEHEKQNWRRRFTENYLPDSWTNEWHTNPDSNGQIYHSDWRQSDGLALEDASVRMHFVHLIRDMDSFEDGTLTIQLRWPGNSAYRDKFKDLFVSDRFADDLDTQLGKHNIDKLADYSYKNPRFTEKLYSIQRTELPGSYYETLQQAVQEHQQLAPLINNMLDTAIEEVNAEQE